MQTFKPIVLTAPGVQPEVALDPIKVVTDRLFVCSNSGGGKSHATRLLIEQAGQQMPVLVIDPEGEWASVREAIPGMALIGSMARGADAPADPRLAGELALRLLKLNCSAVLDVSDLARDEQARFVRLFVESLLNAPPDLINLGRPRLVVIDEAHRFAPEDKGEAESRAAVIQLMDSGRKRGLGVVLVTQRFAKVAKSAIGECNALLIGRFASDVDQRRAADIAGIPARSRGIFGEFEEGEFMASGVAFGNKGKALRFRTNETTATRHPKVGMQVFTPTPRGQKAIASKFSDLRVPDDDETEEPAEPIGTSKPNARVAELELEVAGLRASLGQAWADRAALADRYDGVVARVRKASADLAVALSYVVEIEAIDALADRAENHDLQDDDAEPKVEETDDEPDPEPAAKSKALKSGKPSGASLRLLVTLAQAGGKPVTRRRAALLSKTTVHSSTWRAANAALTKLGYMAKSGSDLVATPAGIKAAGPVAPMPRGAALVGYWRTRLGKGAPRSVFDVLVDAKDPLLRGEVATRSGISETSSTWRGALAKLRGLSLIDDIDKTKLVLAKELR